jgi:hypothetical protein
MLIVAAALMGMNCFSQGMPGTAGETLTGKRIVLADAARGHLTALVAGFSREGGTRCGDWVKAIHGDSALANVEVYQMSMLAGAPGLIRGMIKSSMKKGVPPAQQDHFVVLTQDEKLWRSYFDVSADQDPYIVLLDANGKVLWHGHGAAAKLEAQVKAALW